MYHQNRNIRRKMRMISRFDVLKNGDLVSESHENAEDFASSVNYKSKSPYFSYISSFFSYSPVFSTHISTKKIRQALRFVNVSKPRDPDVIPAIIVEMSTLNWLLLYATSSIKHSTFPTYWRQVVTSIAKSDDPTNPNNYHLISLTHDTSEVFETVSSNQSS